MLLKSFTIDYRIILLNKHPVGWTPPPIYRLDSSLVSTCKFVSDQILLSGDCYTEKWRIFQIQFPSDNSPSLYPPNRLLRHNSRTPIYFYCITIQISRQPPYPSSAIYSWINSLIELYFASLIHHTRIC